MRNGARLVKNHLLGARLELVTLAQSHRAVLQTGYRLLTFVELMGILARLRNLDRVVLR